MHDDGPVGFGQAERRGHDGGGQRPRKAVERVRVALQQPALRKALRCPLCIGGEPLRRQPAQQRVDALALRAVPGRVVHAGQCREYRAGRGAEQETRHRLRRRPDPASRVTQRIANRLRPDHDPQAQAHIAVHLCNAA